MTTKQMGDACEMLVAAEMTLAGMPALKMPDNWPCYDVIAQPPGGGPTQRISVKARTYRRGGDRFVDYWAKNDFDWLAIVLLPGDGQLDRRIFIVPKALADQRASHPKGKDPADMYVRLDRVASLFGEFENNFCLSGTGSEIEPKRL